MTRVTRISAASEAQALAIAQLCNRVYKGDTYFVVTTLAVFLTEHALQVRTITVQLNDEF